MTLAYVPPAAAPLRKSQIERYKKRFRRSVLVTDLITEIERLHWLLNDIQSNSPKCLDRVTKECEKWES